MPFLYSLTIQRATAVTHAIFGNFSAPKAQEIVVSRGKVLELLRPDDAGKVQVVFSTEVFGLIRCLSTFRIVGASRDYIVVGSDSGRIVILEFNTQKNCFEKVHQETYGKSGIRRIVPGQYLGIDPKGRAIALAAIEKQKFVYVVNRDQSARLTISSPLEAHKNNTICHGLCGVDVGFENPQFAALEVAYDDSDRRVDAKYKKTLTTYEMDLGLNHVTRKHADPVDYTAHHLIAVPGGHDGPSGVLVCCENYLVYKKPNHEDIKCAIPRRLEAAQSAQGIMVVCHATHKIKDQFFFFIQSEFGDLYKVTLSHDEDVVSEMQIKYFDSIPVANALCVLKTGFLFVASEFGNHALYQFVGIGMDPNDPLATSSHPDQHEAVVVFKPRAFVNLLLYDEMQSLAPIIDMKVVDAIGEGTPQLYVLCGRGPRSTLRRLRYGLTIEQMAYNELPGKPHNVWTLKENMEDETDRFIVVSFSNETLVLRISDTIEEDTNTLLDYKSQTLHIGLMKGNTQIQITPQRVVYIRGLIRQEFAAPATSSFTMGASNESQCVVATANNKIQVLELTGTGGQGAMQEKRSVEVGQKITCIAIAPVPEGRVKASFMAVGLDDRTVRIFSLEEDRFLKQISAQALGAPSIPESVAFLHFQSQDASTADVLYLHIGCNTGVTVRAVVDARVGTLSDQRIRFLGERAVRLHQTTVQRGPGLLALSTRPWLCHQYLGKAVMVPLSCDTLDAAAPFCSEQVPDGLVAIAENTLRIFQIERLGETFDQVSIPLNYTPRRLVALPPPTQPYVDLTGEGMQVGQMSMEMQPHKIAVVEADHNAYDLHTYNEIKEGLKNIRLDRPQEEKDTMDIDEPGKPEIKTEDVVRKEEEDLPETQVGMFRAGEGKWGSCIRVIDPVQNTVCCKLDLDVDEAALSCAVVQFEEAVAPCLVVGIVYGMTIRPRKVPRAAIKVYSYNEQYQLELVHTTPCEEHPTCFCPFHGRLLVGVGNHLRVYSLGRKRLLRKCEYKNLPMGISWIKVVGDRIFLGDMQDSVHVLKYRGADNSLYVLCDDVVPRYLTCGEVVDYRTVVMGDKFDSFYVARVPEEASEDELQDITGTAGGTTLKVKGDTAYVTGSCHKFETQCAYHVGETVMSLQRCRLSSATKEVIVYATIMGSIGALTPLVTREDVDFFQHLELHLRQEKPPLCGRDHIMFRSYYTPVKNVVDGDLCEQYLSLPPAKQEEIAAELDKVPADIIKKLEDLRNQIL